MYADKHNSFLLAHYYFAFLLSEVNRRYPSAAPRIWNGINAKAEWGAIPAKLLEKIRPIAIAGLAKDVDGIDSMFTLVQGMLNKNRLRDIIRNFIYIPDSSKKDEKIVFDERDFIIVLSED